jgi:hypothetical protein
MWIELCYHRIRIRVKLTCDEMCGSVGAGDQTPSDAQLQTVDGQQLLSPERMLAPTLA